MTELKPNLPPRLRETNHLGVDQRVSIAFIVIDTFFLGIFYLSRYYNRKAVGLPMLVCTTVAFVCCMGSAVAGILMTQIGGVGYHYKALTTPTYENWLKMSKMLEFTYMPGCMWAKLATLCLYHQIFELPGYRRCIYGIAAILILQGHIAIIVAATICTPFSYFWTQAADLAGGSCGDVMLFYKTYSIPSLATDVMMLVLPWPALIRLQIPMHEKIGLVFTFLAASIGIITCALRFVTFFTVPLFEDPPWYASGPPMLYALVEPSVYMIASILPTTRHLVNRLRRKRRAIIEARKTATADGPARKSSEQDESEKSADGSPLHPNTVPSTANLSQEDLTRGEQSYMARSKAQRASWRASLPPANTTIESALLREKWKKRGLI